MGGLQQDPRRRGHADAERRGAGRDQHVGRLAALGRAKSKNPQAAWDFISTALNKENTLAYDTSASQIAERKDVSSDPAYLESDPFAKTFTDLVQYTHFRPAYSKYPRVSDAIQQTMETVMTGQAPVDQALAQYQKTVTAVVGADAATTA